MSAPETKKANPRAAYVRKGSNWIPGPLPTAHNENSLKMAHPLHGIQIRATTDNDDDDDAAPSFKCSNRIE